MSRLAPVAVRLARPCHRGYACIGRYDCACNHSAAVPSEVVAAPAVMVLRERADQSDPILTATKGSIA